MGSSRFTGNMTAKIHPEANPPLAHWPKKYRYREVKDRTRKYDMV